MSATASPRISTPGVAPRLQPLRGIAVPFRADAQAADERDLAVDDDRLAMIARQPRQRAVHARRIEAAHFGAGFAQRRPGPAELGGPEPVVDDADPHALLRLRRQRLDELVPDGDRRR